MKKLIPLDLSLAQRLAAVQLTNPFCGFCRAERAAVEELKSVLLKDAVDAYWAPLKKIAERLESPGETRHPLVNIEEWRKGCSCSTRYPGTCEEGTEGLMNAIQSWFHAWETLPLTGQPVGYDEGGLQRQAINAMPGPARQPVDYDYLRELIAAQKKDTTQGAWDSMCSEAGAVIEDVLADLDQAQATIKEMGELIDQQAAELETLRKLTAGATLTHKTKGGYYRPLGEAAPAGAVKTMIGVPLAVYQDTMSGQLYYRSTHDFAAALEPL